MAVLAGLVASYISAHLQDRYELQLKQIGSPAQGGASGCDRFLFDRSGKPYLMKADGKLDYVGDAPLYAVEPYASGKECRLATQITADKAQTGHTVYPLFFEANLSTSRLSPGESGYLEITVNLSNKFESGDFAIQIDSDQVRVISVTVDSPTLDFTNFSQGEMRDLGLGGSQRFTRAFTPKESKLGEQTIIVSVHSNEFLFVQFVDFQIRELFWISPQLIGAITSLAVVLAAILKLYEPISGAITKLRARSKSQKRRGK